MPADPNVVREEASTQIEALKEQLHTLQQALSDRIVEIDLIRSRNVRIVLTAMATLTDGEALQLTNTYGELLRILAMYTGERGASEGAVDVLQRIIRERDEARRK